MMKATDSTEVATGIGEGDQTVLRNVSGVSKRSVDISEHRTGKREKEPDVISWTDGNEGVTHKVILTSSSAFAPGIASIHGTARLILTVTLT